MKKKATLVVIVISIGLLCHGSWKSLAQPVHATSDIPDPERLFPKYRYDGLTLAPAPVDLNGDSKMLASLVDAHLWKFAAKLTKANTDVICDLEVREKGKPTEVLCTFAFKPFDMDGKTRQDYLHFGVLPMNGDLATGDKIKCQISAAGRTFGSIVDNPFKGGVMMGTPGSDPAQSDIAIFDARVRIGDGRASFRDLTLFLNFKTKPHV